MVNDLGDCLKEFIKEFSSSTLSDSGNSYPLLNQNCKSSKPKRTYSIDQDDKLPDLESFNYMTLAEAEKQHRMYDKYGNAVGEIKAAYKCFEAYAALNQIKAKYYKAYYIFKVAMYNVGNLYYKGSAGEQDIEKATHYMRLAVYNKYAPAIKFCEDHNIPL